MESPKKSLILLKTIILHPKYAAENLYFTEKIKWQCGEALWIVYSILLWLGKMDFLTAHPYYAWFVAAMAFFDIVCGYVFVKLWILTYSLLYKFVITVVARRKVSIDETSSIVVPYLLIASVFQLLIFRWGTAVWWTAAALLIQYIWLFFNFYLINRYKYSMSPMKSAITVVIMLLLPIAFGCWIDFFPKLVEHYL